MVNQHLDANLTSAANCRMPENGGSPMRFCCFEGASISAWEKTSIRKEATKKFKQDIQIATKFQATNIDFQTILGFKIHNKQSRGTYFSRPGFAAEREGEGEGVLTKAQVLSRHAPGM